MAVRRASSPGSTRSAVTTADRTGAPACRRPNLATVLTDKLRPPRLRRRAGLVRGRSRWLAPPCLAGAWIHPFGDGNGRTARLCEYLVLVTSGVPTTAAHLISNHCNLTRDEYYQQLRFASESGGDITRFLQYCAEGFVFGLGEQLRYVHDRQFRLTWHEHVAELVTGRDLKMRERRSLIANSLLGLAPVSRREIPLLTPELAAAYSTCGPKTLSRDLNELIALDLLVERDGGYTARDDVMLNLLPLVVPEAASRL